MPQATLTLRVICLEPPPSAPEAPDMLFGLQDKQGQIHSGTPHAEDAAVFECAVTVQDIHENPPNFLGSFTHGTPTARFLYLTYQHGEGATKHIIKRLKIHLKSITTEQIHEALEQEKSLQATVDGQAAASVPLLGEGWQVVG